jgi:hypothetical protein
MKWIAIAAMLVIVSAGIVRTIIDEPDPANNNEPIPLCAQGDETCD